MIVDGKKLIARQLEAQTAETMVFDQDHSTEIVPARLIPVPEQSKVTLDGQWHVKRHPFKEEEAQQTTDYNSWPTLRQPGKVFYADPEAEKENVPNWNRVSLSHIDENDGALLVRRVAVPASWNGKRIFLRFDSIYPAGEIYVNGIKAGGHFSGLTPVTFEVGSMVEPGKEAVICVRLRRKHKFVKMDMPRHALEFAGMAQSAYLFAAGDCLINDYRFESALNQDFSEGSVSGTVTLDNPCDGMLTLRLIDSTGKRVAETSRPVSSGVSEYELGLKIERPALWNDEHPNLYRVEIVLNIGGVETSYSYRCGFRRLELSPSGARLNGSFVKFRGVNHLTFHPEHGLHTPKEWLRECLGLMKKANVNAIRTHFTGPSDFVDLCDEMGFYLLQELPIDWGTNYIHDPEWTGPALTRLEGAIRRDRHHPSVMVWSVGNENMPESAAVAADGWNHLRIYHEFCKTLDPSRPTMFPPPGPANKIEGIFELRVGDVADTHYSFKLQKEFRETGVIVNPNSWEADMVSCTREEALARGWSGCWFSSEYGIFNCCPDILNGPYLSVIADRKTDPLCGRNTMELFVERLRDEWGNMRHDSTCLGGAYFPWLSAGAGKGPEGNPWGWTRWGEDANWGVVTADLLPKPQFWAMRVLFAPVWFPAKVELAKGESEIRFQISNHYNSIDLKDCVFRTQQNAGGSWVSMLREFKDIQVECAPGQTTEIRIPIWRENVLKALNEGRWGFCRITMLDPRGFCPVTADILLIPETLAQHYRDNDMPIGPDAVI